MARIECYVSDEIKEKIFKLAEKKSISTSKYISHVLASHCDSDENQAIFQKKVMATLCEIYTCVFDPVSENTNRDSVVSRMRDIKKQCEEAVLMSDE